ncbi:response regulator transcription factor [Paenibacillus sp. PAMC21692]|uniref:response regulator transcription factor n=1 Tax=Paenibacillus sp. PAMC21692 TaxID=2762320 RepID=UPI00164D17D6|nr:response regulator transcription factor [Paenibacillus sp. PAMC21692]QNK56692.1 response regulator transcription factor [Paenibacillus sp. PAMC21692]
MKVVWIEDETELLKECADYLRREDIEVHGAATLSEAETLIREEKPDLLLVDWMLPGGESGLDLCKRNEREWGLPIIMVTAKGDEFDKVLALELGADDYLTKPFGLRELGARMKAVLRRTSKGNVREDGRHREDVRLQRGLLLLDNDKYAAQLEDRRLELTRTEFMLLWKLASHPGRVFTRTHLMDEALGDDYIGYERTIDSHIRNLRKKLGDHEAEKPYIETVYGIGYRFSEEAR